jgi:hypothetical protein
MPLTPATLLLPPTLNCPTAPRLPLRYSDMDAHTPLELLAIPRDDLETLLAHFSSHPSTQEHLKATVALRDGQTQTCDVPVLIGHDESGGPPSAYRRFELLSALYDLGFDFLPVLANKTAATWLRDNLNAKEAPADWQLTGVPLSK